METSGFLALPLEIRTIIYKSSLEAGAHYLELCISPSKIYLKPVPPICISQVCRQTHVETSGLALSSLAHLVVDLVPLRQAYWSNAGHDWNPRDVKHGLLRDENPRRKDLTRIFTEIWSNLQNHPRPAVQTLLRNVTMVTIPRLRSRTGWTRLFDSAKPSCLLPALSTIELTEDGRVIEKTSEDYDRYPFPACQLLCRQLRFKPREIDYLKGYSLRVLLTSKNRWRFPCPNVPRDQTTAIPEDTDSKDLWLSEDLDQHAIIFVSVTLI